MNRKFRIPVMLAFFLLAASCSRSPVVASVNGEKITAASLRAQLQMERGKYDGAVLSSKANFEKFRSRAMDILIDEAILLSEAGRAGIVAAKEEIKEIEKMRAGAPQSGDSFFKERGIDPKFWNKAQKSKLIIGKLIQREVIEKIPVSDGEITAYYKKNPAEFSRPAAFHARQILSDSKEEADQILAKLKTGADFGELAKEFSRSPDGKNGGDIGFFDSRAYPEIFSEICQQLKVGETSDVVETSFGFQIFELLDRRPAYEIPFAEAKEKIRQTLRGEKAGADIEKWIAGLKKKANVSVNEEAVKEVVLD